MHIVSIGPQVVYQALSDPIRIRIVRLHAAIAHELCLCDISKSLEEPDYKISRHLKVLRSSGILTASKEGRWIYHTAVMGVLFLDDLYSSVLNLPDPEKIFQGDLSRCKKLPNVRYRQKCRGLEETQPKRSKSQPRRTR